MFQPHIHYIMGYMIPTNQGSILSLDSSLNRTHRENFYISGYEGPNEILQNVLDREQALISVVRSSDLEDETVTRGILYKFAILKSPERHHLGKTLISPKWGNKFC